MGWYREIAESSSRSNENSKAGGRQNNNLLFPTKVLTLQQKSEVQMRRRAFAAVPS